MNRNSFNPVKIEFSGIGFWIGVMVIAWILGAIGLGWLVNSILILAGLILIAPVIIFLVFRWWLQRNLVQDSCPVCNYEFTGFNNTQLTCPSCGEILQVEGKRYSRSAPPGTIDVDVVDISAKVLDE